MVKYIIEKCVIIEQKLQLKLNTNILLKGQTKWNRERKVVRICKTWFINNFKTFSKINEYICSN